MRLLLLTTLITLGVLQEHNCNKKKTSLPANCYKGRLEIKGLCSNYTITLLQGNIDTSKIMSTWTDENTGRNYQHVFGLGTPCSFPSTINAGDEFYFTIDTAAIQKCMVCMIYYPHPPRSLKIKLLSGSCSIN